MKKFVSILLALVAVLSCFAMSVAAAPKDDVIAAAKKNIPTKYEKYYLVSLENTLNAVEVTKEQAAELVKLIEDTRAVIKTDKGMTLHNYTKEESDLILTNFKKGCDILNLSYKIVDGNYSHKGDVAFQIYDKNGKLLTTLDGDIVKKTDVSAENNKTYMLIAVLAAVVVAGGAAFVFSRKVAAK